ncbi:hypothetical protein G9F71_026330 [Clostridium sp. FP2]|uniref:hypothetical protein n=1 Tax=Clostridium sp. FP2 TaxID=2724481 RepID=UPI0013E924FF|nr:hypothetical protein [Clostridium sp. FP2]MBZ9626326.1 hypothetical protein [Clostridium sp. FP2]
MTKVEFNKLEILMQLKYINSLLEKGKSLRSISSDLNMSKTTFRDRFVKIGYVYNLDTRQYYKDNNIAIQPHDNIKKVPQISVNRDVVGIKEVIQIDNKSISKQENLMMQEFTELKTTLSEVTELLEMKDQLKEVIQYYNKSKNIIDVPVPPELNIEKGKFEGELKGRLIKVYDNVNKSWLDFCKNNNQFKMQDLYSLALLEFIEKYKK